MTRNYRENTDGKVINFDRSIPVPKKLKDPNARRDAIVGKQIVNILKEMLQSWRVPDARPPALK